MENRIKELYDAIRAQEKRYLESLNLLGPNSAKTRIDFNRLVGMQDAFKLVAGMSCTDYFLAGL